MGTTWSCDCFEELGCMPYDDIPISMYDDIPYDDIPYDDMPYDVHTPLLAVSPENSPPGRSVPLVHRPYHPPFTGIPKMEEWDIL